MHTASRATRVRALLLAVAVCFGSACASHQRVHLDLVRAADGEDPLALFDALEALIAAGRDTPADREYAYAIVQNVQEDTAAAMFARAAVTGRLVQQKGLLAANLIADIERCARRSRELDPSFRDGAATRLLGTLYVIAPAALLAHGDSEQGLVLLEELLREHPEVLENHLRLAEAYITLNDPTPAYPHLCRCLRQKGALRGDEQILLTALIADVGTLPCPATP